jgi:DNA-binding response OmpR family regulator
MITDAVWSASYRTQAHSLHVYVGRLWKKLQTGGARRHIVTEPSVGYRFVADGIGTQSS